MTMTEEDYGPPAMDKAQLKAIRTALGASQGQLALMMGMPLRTYQDIEGGQNPIRGIHAAALTYAAMQFYVASGGAGKLPWWIEPLMAKVQNAKAR